MDPTAAGSQQPQPPQTPAAAPGGANMAVMQLRKALGLPENQPAPEQKVIEACTGALGPEIKRMAIAVAQQGGMRPPADGGAAYPPAGPGAEPDGDEGGGATTPAAPAGGRMGSSAIFAQGAEPAQGGGADPEAGASDEDEDDQTGPMRSKGIFGGRR